MLCALAEHHGAVLSRERLEQALYAWGEEVESNTIKVHIHHLRRKLGNWMRCSTRISLKAPRSWPRWYVPSRSNIRRAPVLRRSPKYQAAIPLRQAASKTGLFVTVEGLS